MPNTLSGDVYVKRLYYRNQALQLVGELLGLIAKVEADVQAAYATGHYSAHGSSITPANFFKAAYTTHRLAAKNLKNEILKELGLPEYNNWDFLFEEPTAAQYTETVSTTKEMVNKLIELSVKIDPTPSTVPVPTH